MWNDSYDIMPDELSQIMDMCRKNWICTRFEPGETLYILLCRVDEDDIENIVDKKEFEFVKC